MTVSQVPDLTSVPLDALPPVTVEAVVARVLLERPVVDVPLKFSSSV